ncbi:hypothetical protein [Streptococcus equi]|uniref:hypothetical protein n=1 Tax=Streptococcus equi TaxID=1336 RepID=UPI001E43C148|nr:hypothetical protein [Streptococcus equi]MCD3418457.1 hypothetical protein [Streptococcus equi subsp. zooepidemicus]
MSNNDQKPCAADLLNNALHKEALHLSSISFAPSPGNLEYISKKGRGTPSDNGSVFNIL